MIGRVLRTGLSSLRDRAAARLAALRFNPSRNAKLAIMGGSFFLLGTFFGATGSVTGAVIYWALAGFGLWLAYEELPEA